MSCRGQDGDEIPQDAVQALDIALKHSISYRDEVKTFARAIFWNDPDKVRPLGNGAEACTIPTNIMTLMQLISLTNVQNRV